MKSPYLDNKVLQVAKIYQDSEIFLLSSLTCNQIWPILLVDDHKYSYIIRKRKKKENLMCAYTDG